MHETKNILLKTDGTNLGTSIVDAETGEPILPVEEINIKLNQKTQKATITVFTPKDGDLDHPVFLKYDTVIDISELNAKLQVDDYDLRVLRGIDAHYRETDGYKPTYQKMGVKM